MGKEKETLTCGEESPLRMWNTLVCLRQMIQKVSVDLYLDQTKLRNGTHEIP